jgi:hypothetical protein
MVHDQDAVQPTDALRGAKSDVAADGVEAAEATEEDRSSSDDDGPLAPEEQVGKLQVQPRVRAPRPPKCQRCGRQGIQAAEAVARERRKAKARAGKALQRAKLRRQEQVAAERTKWRKILAEKLEAVRAKAAADKARNTALFWAKKAANKAARLAVGIPTDGTWVWGGEEDSAMKLDEQHNREDNEQSSAVRDATLEAASSSPAGADCPMALEGSEEAEPSSSPPPLASTATPTGS